MKNKGVNKVAWSNGKRRFRGGRNNNIPKPELLHYRKEDADELLELIYTLKESADSITVQELDLKSENDTDTKKLVEEMVSVGLLILDNEVVTFSARGEKEAVKLIRAHRLAERLLTDVLLIEEEPEMEDQACAMEHVLIPEVVNNICTVLGHPRTCPHGLEIPAGSCCREKERRATAAVLPLDRLRSGESGRILYIETTNHDRLDKLTSFGMLPGTILKVHQRQPSLVIIMGETQLALDREIAQHIHVVRTS
jgi:DtxR family Mn-dependent transcriptional regulator